jgi:3-hydroxyisobutyrate dehydrogenase-like beta-hydroxyacid dehydrogenase
MVPLRVGFIGLGNLGMPMAKKILKKQIPLTVCDLRKDLIEEMRVLGAATANSPKELATVSEVIISMVNDIADTDKVIFGRDGVWDSINKDTTIVISSTVGPSYCQSLYKKAKERDVKVVDAPVSKNAPSNDAGEYTLMIGGDDEDIARCWPIFEALATHIFHLGGIGIGQTYKLLNNLLAGGLIVFTRECINMGLKAGLNLEKMIDVMQVSTGNNWYLSQLDHQIQSQRTHSNVRLPRQTKNVAPKDRSLGLELAEQAKANIPIAHFIHNLDTKSLYEEFFHLMEDKGINL